MNDMSAGVFRYVVLPGAFGKVGPFLDKMMSDIPVDTSTTPFTNPVDFERHMLRKNNTREAQQKQVYAKR